jgi:hypothetical protein
MELSKKNLHPSPIVASSSHDLSLRGTKGEVELWGLIPYLLFRWVRITIYITHRAAAAANELRRSNYSGGHLLYQVC